MKKVKVLGEKVSQENEKFAFLRGLKMHLGSSDKEE